MHNLDKLKAVIRQEAQGRAAEMRSAARTKGERMVEEANLRASAGMEEAVKAAELAAAENQRRAAVTRSLDQRNAVLRAKGEMVDKLISEIPQAVRAIGDQNYLKLLRRMMLEAAPEGQADVIVAGPDADKISSAFLEGVAAELARQGRTVSLKVVGRDDSLAGGFILRTGTLEVDCSLDALVAMSEDELAPLVAEALFGGR